MKTKTKAADIRKDVRRDVDTILNEGSKLTIRTLVHITTALSSSIRRREYGALTKTYYHRDDEKKAARRRRQDEMATIEKIWPDAAKALKLTISDTAKSAVAKARKK